MSKENAQAIETSSEQRRRHLIQHMRSGESNGHHCMDCTGTCCTSAHNTMHVSPLEAVDLMVDMKRKGRWNIDWMTRLKNNESENLLDRPPLWNGKTELRRSYTCPFFNVDAWGCGCAVEQKPYGCIAFNPREKGVTDGGQCRSSLDDLKHQASLNTKEVEWNNIIKKTFQIQWDKKAIPSALLSLWTQEQKNINSEV
jgi:hypothetical protein